MAFESLSDRLQNIFKNMTKKGKLDEKDVDQALREVRLAMLEADVNYIVVKSFMQTVKEKAIGEKVWTSLTPAQQVIKIVNDELTELMGAENVPLLKAPQSPTVIMMVGLQGSGKTTSTGKLANHIRKRLNGKPMLVAADIYRPAAVEQLKTLGRQLDVPVFDMGTDVSPVEIAKQGIAAAKEQGCDYVLVDTAGRLHIDEALMDELQAIKTEINPTEILLVVDAMTGQDAINVTIHFHDHLRLSGAILTKLDGDARGGAALSIRQMASIPIKFIGTGEKLAALEPFYPDRMASRILGMGDVLSLIEKAQEDLDEDVAMKSTEKMLSGQFDLEDFLAQMQQMKKLGPLEGILKMLPGAGQMGLDKVNIDPKQMAHVEAIIYSMTPEERKNPSLLNHKRKLRISKGCGRGVPEINRLLKQFEQSKKMMKQMSSMMGGQPQGGKKGKKGKKGMPNLSQMPNMPTGGNFPGLGGLPGLGGKGGFPGMGGKGGKGGFPF